MGCSVKAIIGGTSLLSSPLFNGWYEKETQTAYGKVYLRLHEDAIYLQRHGKGLLPPHRINHWAHIQALKDLGVSQIIGVNSVGSLKTGIKPGMFVVPDDFLSPWEIPTFFDDRMKFIIPSMDSGLAVKLHKVCREAGLQVVLGGIYIQTRGPRLETRAEIEMLKKFGDVVGMTMASEATLCAEHSIPYASLCSVDNYCHGISKKPLAVDEISAHALRSTGKIEKVIALLLTKDRL